MKSVCVMITEGPFGTVHAAEALRLANGATAYGHRVTILLVDDGVLVAKKGQKAEEAGWTSLSAVLEKAASGGARVLADRASLDERGLAPEELVEGVEVVGEGAVSSVIDAGGRVVAF
jgi:uncharacterized protein involved in oxidation of intracellular sulfur